MATYFIPPYVPHAGESLKEKIEEMEMSVKEFAVRVNKPIKTIHAVLSGKSSITSDMAVSFENVTGIPAHFWLQRQAQYDEFVARERKQEVSEEEKEFLQQFDYKAMSKYGWVEQCRSVSEKLQQLMFFFKIANIKSWDEIYVSQKLKVAFRASLKNVKNPYNTSAWLCQGERQAAKMQCKEYDKNTLLSSIKKMQQLANGQEDDYLTKLQGICAEAGVKLVYVPRIKGVPINGAMRWIGNNPLIQLSDKQKAYDVFWFSFFHEVGHILQNKKKEVYIEFEDFSDWSEMEINQEKKADEFASEILLPKKIENVIMGARKFTAEDILSYSTLYGIHPAFIVGRLHHNGTLGFFVHHNMIPQVVFAS